LGEDVVAIALDLIEDLRIEHSSRPDAARRSRWQHRDSCIGKRVESTIALNLVRQEGPPLRRQLPAFKINFEEPKIILRQVDATSIKIFVDVAEEIGELEG
jgi:hypothetical protein